MEKIIDDLDSGNSNISEEDCDEVIKTINHYADSNRKFSKCQAYRYLGIGRSTFDLYVKEGKLPEGKKELGFKEKFWTRRTLDDFRSKYL